MWMIVAHHYLFTLGIFIIKEKEKYCSKSFENDIEINRMSKEKKIMPSDSRASTAKQENKSSWNSSLQIILWQHNGIINIEKVQKVFLTIGHFNAANIN